MLSSLRRGAVARVGRWARRRQGTDPATTKLRPGRVYILPTGVGIVFGIMVFAMLLGSMNYNNNLSFVLTFILIGIGFVSMHQCQRNLVGLELTFAGTEPVFAGQAMRFGIAVANRSKTARYGIRLYREGIESDIHDLKPGESKVFILAVPTEQRGWITLDRFGIRTLFPFELFRAWAWLHMDISAVVFPQLATNPPEPPPTMVAHGHRQHDARGEEDFAGLRKYHEGDSPRHVAWKAYARSGQLLSKQFAGADTSSQWFDYDHIPVDDVEQRLSILTRWVVDADRTREDYGLRLPGTEFEPAHGEAHRRACLEALALFEKGTT
ncbi:MAG: DUF58 domain-containing protein [Gammaproteobacteria bacterium]|nr:DUF58 domain-containing protein [Gammaproteobacteria bacterium]MDH3362943.1 DUF58 domain-containing protein [Gammaproteobacteria bacterium]MDH3481127.1 DUF58 domain-containing protein [Gammaproteobacteria bacterium]